MKKILPVFLILLCSISVLSGCSQSVSPQSVNGFFFDTFIVITVYEDCPQEVLNGTLDICRFYESLLSPELEGSDIWNINHSNGSPVSVHPDTAYLIQQGMQYSALTEGAFDISIRPVSSMWDFHSPAPKLPDSAELLSALSHVDVSNIQINDLTVNLLDPSMALDLGALSKGFIAEKIKDYLLENKIQSAIINLGGNLCVMGSKPDGSLFHLGIEKPFSNGNEVAYSFSSTDCNLVTSGIYERFFYVDDTLYHHILDARTGYPIQNDLASVSILGPDGLTCDALSTVCLLLGEEKAITYLDTLDDYEGYFIRMDGSSNFTTGFCK